VVEENPFLLKFYNDIERYAFQTQIFFLLSRYRQQIELAQLKSQLNITNVPINIPDTVFPNSNKTSCNNFDQNLSYGLRNDNKVKCLQEFLKNQGTEIYPEGLVTGNFFSLTKSAVIRFQEKYASEILTPLGLLEGTGYFGSNTRAKINNLLTK